MLTSSLIARIYFSVPYPLPFRQMLNDRSQNTKKDKVLSERKEALASFRVLRQGKS